MANTEEKTTRPKRPERPERPKRSERPERPERPTAQDIEKKNEELKLEAKEFISKHIDYKDFDNAIKVYKSRITAVAEGLDGLDVDTLTKYYRSNFEKNQLLLKSNKLKEDFYIKEQEYNSTLEDLVFIKDSIKEYKNTLEALESKDRKLIGKLKEITENNKWYSVIFRKIRGSIISSRRDTIISKRDKLEEKISKFEAKKAGLESKSKKLLENKEEIISGLKLNYILNKLIAEQNKISDIHQSDSKINNLAKSINKFLQHNTSKNKKIFKKNEEFYIVSTPTKKATTKKNNALIQTIIEDQTKVKDLVSFFKLDAITEFNSTIKQNAKLNDYYKLYDVNMKEAIKKTAQYNHINDNLLLQYSELFKDKNTLNAYNIHLTKRMKQLENKKETQYIWLYKLNNSLFGYESKHRALSDTKTRTETSITKTNDNLKLLEEEVNNNHFNYKTEITILVDNHADTYLLNQFNNKIKKEWYFKLAKKDQKALEEVKLKTLNGKVLINHQYDSEFKLLSAVKSKVNPDLRSISNTKKSDKAEAYRLRFNEYKDKIKQYLVQDNDISKQIAIELLGKEQKEGPYEENDSLKLNGLIHVLDKVELFTDDENKETDILETYKKAFSQLKESLRYNAKIIDNFQLKYNIDFYIQEQEDNILLLLNNLATEEIKGEDLEMLNTAIEKLKEMKTDLNYHIYDVLFTSEKERIQEQVKRLSVFENFTRNFEMAKADDYLTNPSKEQQQNWGEIFIFHQNITGLYEAINVGSTQEEEIANYSKIFGALTYSQLQLINKFNDYYEIKNKEKELKDLVPSNKEFNTIINKANKEDSGKYLYALNQYIDIISRNAKLQTSITDTKKNMYSPVSSFLKPLTGEPVSSTELSYLLDTSKNEQKTEEEFDNISMASSEELTIKPSSDELTPPSDYSIKFIANMDNTVNTRKSSISNKSNIDEKGLEAASTIKLKSPSI